MNSKEIIEMARDSGMELYGLGKNRARFVYHLEAFAKLVTAKEREDCATIADIGFGIIGSTIATAIRARGEQA
ncbi:hypothetical protein UFOVP259_23 [uncultured Caudovirales phage]|uniref:Uncharacterized protein n=1 Tax=uncultured Caudovirales phage TaxID=2100421 RepID=A0A6J5LL21_9CAUD|nr:hypothetical protein UFOVP259_23 [uncultured Caudovirales phage]